jgi:formylglycine-generating enzyme required for sulfatase activity
MSGGLKLGNGQSCPTCSKMVVVPAGSFMMGSPASEGYDNEQPQRKVSFSRAFAVGRFTVTFDEWDACVADGGCNGYRSSDYSGRGKRPVIHVSWSDAKLYLE